MSDNKRRDLLKLSALAAAGFIMPSASLKATNWLSNLDGGNNAILKKFGLQLYSLRDDLPKDPKAILKQVANFGYKQIESYEGAQGMFWGMSNTEFKSLMGDLGMEIISSHCDIKKDFEAKVEKAAAIGMKYLICPYLGPQKTIDVFKQTAETFNKCGEICKNHNIKFAYHNHDYSFKKIDAEVPIDVMLKNTDADKVYFELDIYWAVTAGVNPADYFKKYKNRFTLCHVKDRSKNANKADANSSCILGEGIIDYAPILKVAKANGMQYFIVEQERYDNSTPLISASKDADYMKRLSF